MFVSENLTTNPPMKKNLAIFAAILVVLAFQACNYNEDPPPDDKKYPNDSVPGIIIFTDNFEWQIVMKGWEEAPPGMEWTYHCDTITCYYSGDTTITDVINMEQIVHDYKLFRYDKVATASGGYNDTSYSSGIHGYLRIDSATNKVYWRSPYDITDFMNYDFNCEVGDTVMFYAYSWEPIVSSIDTISLGKYKLKRITLNNGSGNMITGIGSSTGIPYHGSAGSPNSVQIELIYFKIDNVKINGLEN